MDRVLTYVKTRCPYCNAAAKVNDASVGKRVRCGTCGMSFEVRSIEQIAADAAANLPAASETMAEPKLETSRAGQVSVAARSREAIPATLGRFKIRELLGEGGFGRVYRAYDPQLDRDIALKIPTFGTDDEARTRRFLDEGKAASRLRHNNIVPIYDSGEADGHCYLVTHLIVGQTLAKRLASAPPTFRQSAEWVRQIAEALEYAHKRKIIHRDITPHNIMIDEEDLPQIMDFGLAKRLDDASRTTDGSVLGTPHYMSPEQARGKIAEIGPASDQYSLGVVFYELLTGKKPFEGELLSVLAQVQSVEPPAPTSLRKDIPQQLARICQTAMRKAPANRFASAADMAQALQRWLDSDKSRAPGLLRLDARPWPQAHRQLWLTLSRQLDRGRQWCRRNRQFAGWIALAIIAMFAFVFLISSRNHRPSASVGSKLAESSDLPAVPDSQTPPASAETTVVEQTFTGHTGKVSAVLLVPSGDLLLTGGNSLYKIVQNGTNVNFPGTDNTVRFWDLHSAQQTSIIEKALGQNSQWQIQGLALSPDGMRIAVASCRPSADFCEATVTVWTVGSQQRLNHFALAGRPGVGRPWFSNDGKSLFAFRNDATLHVLDLVNGKESSALKLDSRAGERTFEEAMPSFCMSSDRSLAFGGMRSGTIQVWSLPDGKKVKEFVGHTGAVACLALSPDDKLLVSGISDGSVRVWNLASGSLTRICEHGGKVSAVAFVGSPDRIVSAGDDKLACLWDVENATKIKTFEGHTDAIMCLDISPDGRILATGSADKTARTWVLPPQNAGSTQTDSPLLSGVTKRPVVSSSILSGWEPTTPVSAPNWELRAGELVNTGEGPSLRTKEKFYSFDLHLEFALPAGADSGVLLRGRYQVQLADSANPITKKAPAFQCGGLIGATGPSQVVYQGPDKWNSLDVRIVGRTVSVTMNNELIVDAKQVGVLDKAALDRRETEPGPLVLESIGVVHGARFRNISLTPIGSADQTARKWFASQDSERPLVAPTATVDKGQEASRTSVPSTGRTAVISGGNWRIEGEELLQTSLATPARILFGDPNWENYDFSAKVMSEGADGVGIMFQAVDENRHHCFGVGCYEQKFHQLTYVLNGTWGRDQGLIHTGKFLPNQWHHATITVRAASVQCFLDGKLEFRHQDDRFTKGQIGFRTWGTPARFRDIEVTGSDGSVLWRGLPSLP